MYRQELETEQLERGYESLSSSDEGEDIVYGQGGGETTGSESEPPDPAGGVADAGISAVDFD